MGLRIRNTENVQYKVVGRSLRRRDQFKADVIWYVPGNVIHNNARFVCTVRLEVHLNYDRMSAGNGRMAEKTKERPLNVQLKSIVDKNAAFLYLAHALIVIARVNGDPKYPSHRHDEGFKDLLKIP